MVKEEFVASKDTFCKLRVVSQQLNGQIMWSEKDYLTFKKDVLF